MAALKQLIKQAVTQEKTTLDAREEEKRTEQEVIIQKLQTWLWQTLGAEVYDALAPWSTREYDYSTVMMHFQYGDEPWTLTLSNGRGGNGFTTFTCIVNTVSLSSPPLPSIPGLPLQIMPKISAVIHETNHLRHTLLLKLGEYDIAKAKRQAELAVLVEQRNAEQAALVEKQRQEKARDEALRADILSNQADYQRAVDDVIAQAEADRWVWPEGKTLTLYLWQWHYGGVTDIGEAWGDTDTGWSLMDTHQDGWVHLLNPDRDIKMIPELHTPVVMRYTYDSIDAMKRCTRGRYLVQHHSIKIDGYTQTTIFHNDGIHLVFDTPVWIKRPDKNSMYGSGYNEPVEWVKDLLEAA